MELTRRGVLAGGAATATALAGCIGGSSNSSGLTLTAVEAPGSPRGEVVVAPSGRAVLLDFFATWCAPCKPQMAGLRAARERFDEADLAMRSITSETDRDAVVSFWREYEGTWPVAVDPDLRAANRYDATRIPTLVVLDGEGTEVWRHVGLAATDAIVSAVEDAS